MVKKVTMSNIVRTLLDYNDLLEMKEALSENYRCQSYLIFLLKAQSCHAILKCVKINTDL